MQPASLQPSEAEEITMQPALFQPVGGGVFNKATGSYSTVPGGRSNGATSSYSTVGGGQNNNATNSHSTVGGGSFNTASGIESTVGGGDSNTASGLNATIPGGVSNLASGDYSFAAGRRAQAVDEGSFVWADSEDADFSSSDTDQFSVRASNGVSFVSNVAGNLFEFVNIDRTDIPFMNNDVVSIGVPAGSPDNFQFIECEVDNDIKFRVHGDGDVTADGTISGGGADFAEMIPVSTGANSVEAGDVMVIDPANPMSVAKSSDARSTLVAGIYSTKPGLLGSEREWDDGSGDDDSGGSEMSAMESRAMTYNEIPMAVVGIVPCKASAENGAISPGDLLVTSSTPGHVMRDDDPKNGSIVGKALEGLAGGTGVIKVLVTLQ